MSTSASYRLLLIGPCLVLLGCGSDPVGKLIAQLDDSDVATRRTATRALGTQSEISERVVAALAKSIDDSDAEVRHLSIYALGNCGPAATASLPALVRALRDRESSERVKAAVSIQKIDPHEATSRSILVEAMRQGDGRALLEVGSMGANAAWAVPALIQLLSHDLAKVRALAAQTLGRLGPPAGSAEAALKRSLHDPNVAVQDAARHALELIQAQRDLRE